MLYQDQVYVLGGAQQKRQISRLTGCEIERLGSTQFDFSFGACGVFDEKVLLCFDHNHPYSCWVYVEVVILVPRE